MSREIDKGTLVWKLKCRRLRLNAREPMRARVDDGDAGGDVSTGWLQGSVLSRTSTRWRDFRSYLTLH